MLQNHNINDDEIEKAVKELMRNSRADYSHVKVTVDARNVRFTGVVDSAPAREHLSEMAQMIQGTGVIMNDVTLKH